MPGHDPCVHAVNMLSTWVISTCPGHAACLSMSGPCRDTMLTCSDMGACLGHVYSMSTCPPKFGMQAHPPPGRLNCRACRVQQKQHGQPYYRQPALQRQYCQPCIYLLLCSTGLSTVFWILCQYDTLRSGVSLARLLTGLDGSDLTGLCYQSLHI